MTKQEREAIQKRCEAAPPAPWYADGWAEWDDDLEEYVEIHDTSSTAQFIAHARNDIPALLDALEAETERADKADNMYLLRKSEILDLQSDRDCWKSRAEALKKVIKSKLNCQVCVHDGTCRRVGDISICKGWQFDEAWFAKGGDGGG